MDLDGCRLKEQLSPDVWRMIRAIAALDQANYPERLAKMVFVNAPWTFQGVWAVVRGFLDPHTAAKIEVRMSCGGAMTACLCLGAPEPRRVCVWGAPEQMEGSSRKLLAL